MLLRLGDKMMIADRMPGGMPGPAYGRSGWGMPSWAGQAPMGGSPVPSHVGARYTCGDGYDKAHEGPCTTWNRYTGTKEAYQEGVTAHYTDEHPDLHYPIDQAKDDLAKVVAKEKARRRTQEIAEETLTLLRKLVKDGGPKGGVDISGEYLRVERPRELPDFTELDFPDADVADAGTEEIELDQLISIAARQGRRFLGLEIENLDNELAVEMITLAADTVLSTGLQLNTRAGTHHLDDPENLWRANLFATINVTEGSMMGPIWSINNPPPGGLVYVAPRLFWRYENNLDRQVDAGDLFVRIATVAQPLSTFLLFELLEQFSGLFGLT